MAPRDTDAGLVLTSGVEGTAEAHRRAVTAASVENDPELTKLESCSMSAIKGNGRMFV
jgi:hypothetical protein